GASLQRSGVTRQRQLIQLQARCLAVLLPFETTFHRAVAVERSGIEVPASKFTFGFQVGKKFGARAERLKGAFGIELAAVPEYAVDFSFKLISGLQLRQIDRAGSGKQPFRQSRGDAAQL